MRMPMNVKPRISFVFGLVMTEDNTGSVSSSGPIISTTEINMINISLETLQCGKIPGTSCLGLPIFKVSTSTLGKCFSTECSLL
jgi:hypothetical protein